MTDRDPPPTPTQTRELVELSAAPSFLYPTSDEVHGRACSLALSEMSNAALGRPLNQAWELISVLEFGNHKFQNADELQAFLLDANPFEAQLTALAYNIHMNEVGLFGRYGALGAAQLTSGTYQGQTAKELVIRAQTEQSADLEAAIISLNEGFGGCVVGTGSSLRFAFFGPTNTDDDGDGVPASADCDDSNVLVGGLLYENDFSEDDGFFSTTEQLPGDWIWEDGVTYNTGGRQQAMVGAPQNWSDVVVYATVSARGTDNPCGNDAGETPCSGSERWRAGIVARAELDSDQGEGYHGYRCALSSNAELGCYEEGLFLQVGEFMDAAEDGIASEECTDGGCLPNPSFDQLARKNHENVVADLSNGDTAQLTFYTVGRDLYCEAAGASGNNVSVVATDRSMSSGTVGLSTLNMYGVYDHIKVCEAFGTPLSAEGTLDWEMQYGAPLNLADDSFARINMPFSFRFFGTLYSSMWMNSNGNITFNGGNVWYSQPQMPHGLRAIVGILYGDLNPAINGDVFWSMNGTAPNRRLVASWVEVPEFLRGGRNTFQITLFEGSNNIQLSYDIIDTPGFNWNEIGGTHPAQKVGISSGNGRFIRTTEGDGIPGLENKNVCYVYDGIANYTQVNGFCP